MSSIPVIDFASCGLKVTNELNDKQILDVSDKLYDALRTCGFTYLQNTGIDKNDVAAVNDVTKEFFTAPLEKKMKYVRKEDNYGYVSLRSENIDPSKPSDYKEAFNINVTNLDNSDTHWPTDISETFPDVISDFMDKCKELTLRILKAIGVGMRLEDTDHFVKSHLGLNEKKGNHTALRTLFYPPLPGDMPVDHIRLGRHSDYGSVTLLFQDNIGGLQVESLEGDFFDAVPIEDTVLINIGDLLQSWSRNKLKSTKHRVINPTDPDKRKQVRRSMAYFVHPDDHVLVDEELVYEGCPVKTTTDDANKPRVTALDYLYQRFAQTY